MLAIPLPDLAESDVDYQVYMGVSLSSISARPGLVVIPVPHTPHAFTLTRTSSSRNTGRGTLTISKSSGLLYLHDVLGHESV
jgi:hypothetical protein